jgi:TRAP-type C4-dicarboxylate transport system permease small subunit
MMKTRRIESLLKIFDRVFFWLSAATLGGMTIAIFLQVIFRYIINFPLAWSEELARFLFIWMTFVGGYVAARRGQHIGVELVQNMLPTIAKKTLQLLSNLISTAFFALVAYYCVSLWDKLSAQLAPATMLPMSYVYLGMILGCIFMAICYAYYSIALCIAAKDGEGK